MIKLEKKHLIDYITLTAGAIAIILNTFPQVPRLLINFLFGMPLGALAYYTFSKDKFDEKWDRIYEEEITKLRTIRQYLDRIVQKMPTFDEFMVGKPRKTIN